MPFDETLRRALDELARELTAAAERDRAEAAAAAAADARDAAKHDIAAAERAALQRGREEGRQLGHEEGRQRGLEEGRRQGLDEGREQGLQDARAQALVDADARRAADLGTSQRLADALRAIDRGRSLSEILDTLASCAGREAARVAVLLVRGDRLHGWRFIGFGPELDQRTDFEMALEDGGIIREAVVGAAPVSGDSAAGAVPSFAPLPPGRELLAAPVILSGDVVAVLYGDQGPDAGRDARFAWPATLEATARYAARCLEAMTAFRAAQLAVQAPVPPSATSAAAEAEQSARRYARLLVSEIKLYHEPEVIAGRRERDLAVRLGGEIARARVLYEQRVPRQTRAAADFFNEELVRTLADGDASLLDVTS